MDINNRSAADRAADHARRRVDVQTAAGKMFADVCYRDMESCLRFLDVGREDFLILKSHDGFLQFYGVNNQFVAELRIQLADGDFRTYSVIDGGKADLTERIFLVTPYGQFTPTAREVLSFAMLQAVVGVYYDSMDERELLAGIAGLQGVSYVETTEETKRYMGK